MPLKPLLKNKLLLQKHFHVIEFCIDEWPFWLLEENIKIVNELTDEEEQQRKTDEGQQQNIGNFNPGNVMNSFNSGISNLPNIPKF